jgi:hypothetical protein
MVVLWHSRLVRALSAVERRTSTQAKRSKMTGKADFTQEEWEQVLQGPPSAGLIVVTAARGGTIRETVAIAKAYVEARQQHGASELLDEIVAAKPEMDHTHYRSVDELRQHGLQHLRDAVAALESKANPEELEDYRRFVLTLAEKVASAHREGGEAVSDSERQAIEEIKGALGA